MPPSLTVFLVFIWQNPPKQQILLLRLQERIELGHFSQDANFWFSSHNFGEVVVIQKIKYFQSFVWGGHVMSPNMTIPYKTLFILVVSAI